jgi:ubiquinone/menaquinone biosynthesis C-methylase UbiE
MPDFKNYIWHLYALIYDQVNQSVLYQELLQEIVDKLEISPHLTIFDAGTGTGNLEKFFVKKRVAGLQIVAADNNPGMLNRAKKKGYPDWIIFRKLDLNQVLPFDDETFDRIVSINVLYALDNPQNTIREFWRVLKPNGLLVVANPHDQSDAKQMARAHLAQYSNPLRKLWFFTLNLPLVLVNTLISRLGKRKTYHFLSTQKMTEMLEDVGFKPISVSRVYADQDLLVKAMKIRE